MIYLPQLNFFNLEHEILKSFSNEATKLEALCPRLLASMTRRCCIHRPESTQRSLGRPGELYDRRKLGSCSFFFCCFLNVFFFNSIYIYFFKCFFFSGFLEDGCHEVLFGLMECALLLRRFQLSSA